MIRWTSRDVLLRATLLLAVSAFYSSPMSFLHDADASDAASRVQELRLWLTLCTTVGALLGVISTPLLIVSCIHAALHVVQTMLRIPLWNPTVSRWQWHRHDVAVGVYEYGCIMSFVVMLRYVLIPSPSLLSTTRRHSRYLKRYFQQHDRKYVGLVDRLLDDYTGNERLLFARIRKIYRTKTLSPQ